MRPIDDHPQPVHLPHHLFPELGQALSLLPCAELVGHLPGQLHFPQPSLVEIRQESQVSFEQLPAFVAKYDGRLPLLPGRHDV